MIVPLLDAEQNDPALRIGKGGVRLPQAFGQPADGEFGFQAVALAVAFEVRKVDHTIPLAAIIAQLFPKGKGGHRKEGRAEEKAAPCAASDI